MKHRSLKTNASGYSDPTAYNAVTRADRMPKEKVDAVLEDIYKVCKQHGVYIYGDIAFVDRESKVKGRKHLYYREYLNWKKN